MKKENGIADFTSNAETASTIFHLPFLILLVVALKDNSLHLVEEFVITELELP